MHCELRAPDHSPRPQLADEPQFSALHELIVRTVYWHTFGPLMPLAFAARFREHAASMPLAHAVHDLEHCFRVYPERRHA